MTDAHDQLMSDIQAAFEPFEHRITAAREEAEERIAEMHDAAAALATAESQVATLRAELAPLGDSLLGAQLADARSEVRRLKNTHRELSRRLEEAIEEQRRAEARYAEVDRPAHLVWSAASNEVGAIQRQGWQLRDELLDALKGALRQHVEAPVHEVRQANQRAHELRESA